MMKPPTARYWKGSCRVAGSYFSLALSLSHTVHIKATKYVYIYYICMCVYPLYVARKVQGDHILWIMHHLSR